MGAAFGRAPESASDPWADQVREAWNLMGGAIDWAALPVVAEMIGITDVDLLVRGLCQIRQHFDDKREAARAASSH